MAVITSLSKVFVNSACRLVTLIYQIKFSKLDCFVNNFFALTSAAGPSRPRIIKSLTVPVVMI